MYVCEYVYVYIVSVCQDSVRYICVVVFDCS